jgi:hypothetical protein
MRVDAIKTFRNVKFVEVVVFLFAPMIFVRFVKLIDVANFLCIRSRFSDSRILCQILRQFCAHGREQNLQSASYPCGI